MRQIDGLNDSMEENSSNMIEDWENCWLETCVLQLNSLSLSLRLPLFLSVSIALINVQTMNVIVEMPTNK